MAKSKKQVYTGIVYSTDQDFEYQMDAEDQVVETLPPAKQKLIAQLDKKARKGKMVTLVKGFVGTEDDLNALGKLLKQKCAVGGSVKDGEVILQGDFRKRIQEVLSAIGYNVKILG
jgi:translation initiation factor 1